MKCLNFWNQQCQTRLFQKNEMMLMLHEINSVKHSCFEIPLMLTVHSICICICIYFEVWGARYIYLCDVYIYLCIYIYTYLMSCLMCHIKMNVSCGILHFKWKGWVGRDTKHIGVFRFIPPCNPRLPTLMHGGGVIPMQKPNKTCCLDQNQNAHMQMQRNVCERNWNNFWPAYHPCPPTREKNDFRFQWVHSVSCHVCLCLFSRF